MIEEFLKQADDFVSQKKYKELIEFCNEKLKALFESGKPLTDEERVLIATMYRVMANYLDDEQALKCMDAAIQTVSNSPSLYYQRGVIKERMSDFDGAISDYSIVIENAPNAEAYAYRGTAKVRKNDIEGAIADFNVILEHEPEREDVKKAINSVLVKYAFDNKVEGLECTLKDGRHVIQFPTPYGVAEIPAEEQ